MANSIESIIEEYDYSELIEELRKGFANEITVPQRQHYNFQSSVKSKDSTLLIMPAWENEKRVGVKLVTVSPENSKLGLPSINGIYTLFDAKDGSTLIQFDARLLTTSRTACASALASSYLSKKNSSSLLMIGSGALAPHLIKAHCATRPINEVFIWNRNKDKADKLASTMNIKNVKLSAIDKLDEYIPKVDIISSATLSESPIIKGSLIREGTHIDLVGAYQKNMREADDLAIERSSIFVDTFQGMLESGDIAIPIEKGLIKNSDIKGDLFSLVREDSNGRDNNSEITLFKSVGHALEDLVAANFFYEKLKRKNND